MSKPKTTHDMSEVMKTYQEWEEHPDGLSLTEYLQPGDEIDEEIFEYMAGVVPPQYYDRTDDGWRLQSGEAEYERDGVYYYLSFQQIGENYFYEGILPEISS